MLFFCRKQATKKKSGPEPSNSSILLNKVASQFECLAQSVRSRPLPTEAKPDNTEIFSKYLAFKLREVPKESMSLVEEEILEVVFRHIRKNV